MKQLLAFLFILLSFNAFAQQSNRLDPYMYWNNMTIGKGNDTKPDSSAYLDIGPIPARKGVLIPRGYKEAVVNPKQGLLFFDLAGGLYVYYNGWRKCALENDTTVFQNFIDTMKWDGTKADIAKVKHAIDSTIVAIAGGGGGIYSKAQVDSINTYLATIYAKYNDTSLTGPLITRRQAATTYQPIGSYLTSETDPQFTTRGLTKDDTTTKAVTITQLTDTAKTKVAWTDTAFNKPAATKNYVKDAIDGIAFPGQNLQQVTDYDYSTTNPIISTSTTPNTGVTWENGSGDDIILTGDGYSTPVLYFYIGGAKSYVHPPSSGYSVDDTLSIRPGTFAMLPDLNDSCNNLRDAIAAHVAPTPSWDDVLAVSATASQAVIVTDGTGSVILDPTGTIAHTVVHNTLSSVFDYLTGNERVSYGTDGSGNGVLNVGDRSAQHIQLDTGKISCNTDLDIATTVSKSITLSPNNIHAVKIDASGHLTFYFVPTDATPSTSGILTLNGSGNLLQTPYSSLATASALTTTNANVAVNTTAIGLKLASFNGRTATAVVPTTGDYTFAQIGSTPTALAGYGITDGVNTATGVTNLFTSSASGHSLTNTASTLAAHTYWGNNTGSSATGAPVLLSAGDMPSSVPTSIGTIDGQTAVANGAQIIANVLYLQTAASSSTTPGVIATGATHTWNASQTFSRMLTNNHDFVGTSASTAVAVNQIGGSTNVTYGSLLSKAFNANPSAGNSASATVFGSAGLTIASSGTHPVFATAAFVAPVITTGSGAVTVPTTVYISGAPASVTGATNVSALYVASGKSYLGGDVVTDGNLSATTTGKGLLLKSATNGTAGDATLSSGSVTVSNTTVDANTRIFCQYKGTVSGANNNFQITMSAGTSFTITAQTPGTVTTATGDNNTVTWWYLKQQ